MEVGVVGSDGGGCKGEEEMTIGEKEEKERTKGIFVN
jgi:hypothetical protein